MRRFPLIVAIVILSSVAIAQDAPPSAADTAPELSSYFVRITEFRMEAAADPTMTADDIMSTWAQAGRAASGVVQTVRVSALEGHPCSLMVTRQQLVVDARSRSGSGTHTTSTTQETLGTTVDVTIRLQGEHVLLDLSYAASRLEEPEEIAPDLLVPSISSVRCQTTVRVVPGEPHLLAGISADNATHLMVTVER